MQMAYLVSAAADVDELEWVGAVYAEQTSVDVDDVDDPATDGRPRKGGGATHRGSVRFCKGLLAVNRSSSHE